MQNHLYLYPNLAKARKKKCSQAELAEQLGITQQEVSQYERGKIKAPINYLLDVADYCGVSIEYILGRSTEPRDLLTDEEAGLLHLFQQLSPLNRTRLHERAESLLSVQNENQ